MRFHNYIAKYLVSQEGLWYFKRGFEDLHLIPMSQEKLQRVSWIKHIEYNPENYLPHIWGTVQFQIYVDFK